MAPGSTPLILRQSPCHSGPPAWVSAFLPAIHPPHPAGALLCYKMPRGCPLLQAALAADSPRASQLPWLWSLLVRGSVSWHTVSRGLHSAFLSRGVPQGLHPCVLTYRMLVKTQSDVHCARWWQKTARATEFCLHGVHSRGGSVGETATHKHHTDGRAVPSFVTAGLGAWATLEGAPAASTLGEGSSSLTYPYSPCSPRPLAAPIHCPFMLANVLHLSSWPTEVQPKACPPCLRRWAHTSATAHPGPPGGPLHQSSWGALALASWNRLHLCLWGLMWLEDQRKEDRRGGHEREGEPVTLAAEMQSRQPL